MITITIHGLALGEPTSALGYELAFGVLLIVGAVAVAAGVAWVFRSRIVERDSALFPGGRVATERRAARWHIKRRRGAFRVSLTVLALHLAASMFLFFSMRPDHPTPNVDQMGWILPGLMDLPASLVGFEVLKALGFGHYMAVFLSILVFGALQWALVTYWASLVVLRVLRGAQQRG